MSTFQGKNFPYNVDYNDHFETPIIAYEHILPLLDALHPRSTHILYDPYFCNGRTKRILQSLGFDSVIHEKRDFYRDIEENRVPVYHTLVTNPPYSSNHKERCIRFAIEKLRGSVEGNDSTKCFFILMPNYVAVRNHFKSAVCSQEGEDPMDIFYVLPQIPYEYDHPEGTGKDLPPFSSIWYCGVPSSKIDAVKNAFREVHGKNSVGISQGSQRDVNGGAPMLLSSLHELRILGAVPTEKRKNLKQRLKAKRKRQQQEIGSTKGMTTNPNATVVKENTDQKTKKKSKYRDETGQRKKKRF
mmetsp:Transcript_2116/g.3877  ORF Transcript_2116/g.3877 Transcript_2116/m.3877 type:complete len:300 (-) Transcript_2116:2395-3294(-)